MNGHLLHLVLWVGVLALLAVEPARSQPLRAAPPDLAYRLPSSVASGDGAADSAYKALAAVTLGSLNGALLGGGAALAYVSTVVLATLGGGEAGYGPITAFYVVGSTAGAVGATILVYVFNSSIDSRRGNVPYESVDALPGAFVGLVPAALAILVASKIGGEDAALVTGAIAIPVFQSIGATVSINLGRAR